MEEKVYSKVELKNARKRISHIFDILADAVGDTMGPGGQNALIVNGAGRSIITKDGVTVANSIKPGDKELDMITDIIKQAADRTNREAGDGTTTSTVLARAIFKKGLRLIESGHNVVEIKKQLDTARSKLIEAIDNGIKQDIDEDKMLETLQHIAMISLNGDAEMASLVSEAVFKTGKSGIVKIQDSDSHEDKLEKEEGIQFQAGYLNPFFADKRDESKVVFENCYIFITSHKLTSAAQLGQLEKALGPLVKRGAPLLVISSECSGAFLANLMANHKASQLKNCPVRAPYWGLVRKEFYTDLAALTGAAVIEVEEGMELDQVTTEHFGFAARVEVDSLNTTIIGGRPKQGVLEHRIQALKEAAEKIDPDKDLDKVHERLAKITEGVMMIKVARTSDVESEERKYRIEDAVNACRAALADGYVPGGGATLIHASSVLANSELPGEKLLWEAIQVPLQTIAKNAGHSGEVAAEKVFNKNNPLYAYDAIKNEVVPAYTSGIIDPAKVTKTALRNAVSVASTLLTTNVIVSPVTDTAKDARAQYEMFGM